MLATIHQSPSDLVHGV